MKIIDNDRVAYFDCDNTLIMWKKQDKVKLPEVTINGKRFWVHTKHVQKVRDYHCMGFTVVVWSNSGFKWARDVVNALKLQDEVDFAMCKPWRVFDDAKTLNDTIGHGYLPLEEDDE